MTMQHRVTHRTGFSYEGEVTSSYNEARMTPTTTGDQMVLHTRVDVSPNPWTYTYRDYFGTEVTAFEVHERHDNLTVTSTSTVTVNRPEVEPAGLDWAAIRSDEVRNEQIEFLQLSPWVQPGDELVERVRVRAESVAPSELAREVMDLLYAEVKYVRGSTNVKTTAAEAWEQRSGVCQDFAHLTIGCLRSVGVPARYVSGYLHPGKDPELNEPFVGESHAWIEWWDGEWIGWDPTNDRPAGDCHVAVGHGRDYADLSPLRGIFSGGTSSEIFVEVEITRTA